MEFPPEKVKSALLRGVPAGLLVFAACRAAGAVPGVPGATAEALAACFLACVCFYLGARFSLIYGLFLALELTAAFLCRMRVGVYEFFCVAGFPAVAALSARAARGRGRGFARAGRVLCAALTLAASLQYGIYIAYILRYGGRPSTMGMTMALVTNAEEARNFLFDQFGGGYVALAALVAFGASWAALALSRGGRAERGGGVWALLALTAAASFGCLPKAESYSMLAADVARALGQSRSSREAMARPGDLDAEAARLRPSAAGTGELCVIVIGESANRAHMRCYGYDRPTTPRMSASSAILFNNAYACMVQTGPAVTAALSRFNNYGPGARTDEPLPLATASLPLPALLRAAGFRTFWLSNQHSAGFLDNPTAAHMAVSADGRRFLTEDPDGPELHLDGELVPLLRETLAALPDGRNAAVFLHLNGSHWRYREHAPEDWPYLPKSARVDALGDETRENVEDYDRSISYTDSVLAEIARTLRESRFAVSSMVYFSDHGEDVVGGRGHNYDALSPAMTTIPLVFWYSPGYERRWPETVARLRANKDKVFTSDLAFELLCGVAHVTFDGLDEKLQLTSPDYAVTPETARFWQGRLLKEIVPDLGGRRNPGADETEAGEK